MEHVIYRLMAIALMIFFGALFLISGITFAILTATEVISGNFAIGLSVSLTVIGLFLLGKAVYLTFFKSVC